MWEVNLRPCAEASVEAEVKGNRESGSSEDHKRLGIFSIIEAFHMLQGFVSDETFLRLLLFV